MSMSMSTSMIHGIWTYLSAVHHACIVDRAGLDGLGPVGVCREIVMAPDRPSTASKQACAPAC